MSVDFRTTRILHCDYSLIDEQCTETYETDGDYPWAEAMADAQACGWAFRDGDHVCPTHSGGAS